MREEDDFSAMVSGRGGAAAGGKRAAVAAGASKSVSLGFALMHILVGALLLGMYVYTTGMHILTTEAFLLNGAPVSVTDGLSVYMQPIQFLNGEIPANQQLAVLAAWIAEMALFISSISYMKVKSHIERVAPHMGSWLKNFIIVLVFIDMLSDFFFMSFPNGIWVQVIAIVLMAFLCFFSATNGMAMLVCGISEALGGNAIAQVKKYSTIAEAVVQGLGGLLSLALYVLATSFHILSTEAFLLGKAVSKIGLSVFMQPAMFLNNQIAPSAQIIVLVAWGLEIIVFIVSIAWNVVFTHVSGTAKHLLSFFMFVLRFAIILDFLSDLFYNTLPSGLWGQCIAVAAVAFGCFFLAIAGVAMLFDAATTIFNELS